MTYRFIIWSIILFFSATISAQSINTKPDFAYPKQVSANANTNIEMAINTGNGMSLVKSIIDYSIAQSLIDSNNLPQVISRIEEITFREKDPCIKSILYTLLSDIYSEIYNSNRWKYDNRNNPLLPLPKDYNTWDGKQFQHKIVSLCDSALLNSDALKVSPLKDYKSILTHNNLTFIFYPTLYDFIARHIIETIGSYSNVYNTLPSTWLCNHNSFQLINYNYTSPNTKKILSVYQSLISLNKQKPAALFDCEIARISFLKEATYNFNNETAFELLQNLYNEHRDNEYSAEILIAMYEYSQNITHEQWLYENIKYHLNTFPTYARRNCLENLINNISCALVSIKAPQTIAPGDTIDIQIKNENTPKFKINIYYFKNSTNQVRTSYSFGETVQPTLIASFDIKEDKPIPFTKESKLKTTFNRPGNYLIVPIINGDKPDNNRAYKIIRCSNIALLSSNYAEKNWLSVVNSKTGHPIANANIYRIENNKLVNTTLVSDSIGYAPVTLDKFHYLVALKDNNISNTQVFYSQSSNNTTDKLYGQCFTDLAVYHPGDSMQYSAIIYSTNGKSRSLYTNKTLTIKLVDPNRQTKDTISLSTDNWGRISHKFKIPKDGLTGNWSIWVNEHKNYITRGNFSVSDYKLPSYFVEVSEIYKNSPETGAVTLSGKVETYSGFPLSDIETTLNLTVSPNSIWRNPSSTTSFYSTSTATNSDGTFKLVLPADLFANSPIPNGIYQAIISTTSSTGESQETSKRFTLRETYDIIASIDNNIEITQPVNLNVKILDTNDKNINKTIYYTINKGDTTIHTGEFSVLNPIVNWSKIPSGSYSITLSLNDSILAQPYTVNDICLYRKTDKMPPIESSLWVPVTKYSINSPSDKAQILYGTTIENSHIEYFVWDKTKIHSKGWITPTPGVHHFDISLPEGITNLTVSLRTFNNYTCSTHDIEIELNNSTPSIKLEAESFRDKITPGAQETWKFKVTDNTGNGTKSALIFDMYTKALDKIKDATSSWSFNPISSRGASLSFSNPYFDLISASSNSIFNVKSCPQLTIPQINTYGYSLANTNYNSRNISGLKVHSLAIVHDDAVLKETQTTANINSKIEENSQDTNDFSYRAAEVPLAFFEPLLTTDDEGRLSYHFTAPNANTTWHFNAIAYNNALASDNISFDVVSNKPIMVQPNMPRFLRSGDSIEIQASVMNNSDETQIINTTVEIFDYSTNKTLYNYSYDDTIKSTQSTVISSTITAPLNISFIGYRIKSSNGTFSDGEQSIIPILPSSNPIIESTPFYIEPDSNSLAIQLPYTPDNARVTLQFCENPVWYCVTALPGLRANTSRSSISAMEAIFSAAIAEGIIRQNPGIAKALKQWQQSEKTDSTLISMLERNQDLKTILLSSTPWVMDANNDTERMNRLLLLFDKNEIGNTYSSNFKILNKLQRNDGGWSWIDEISKSSEWCTLNILELLGNLKKSGYLPNDKNLDAMISKAIKYIDDKNARSYLKNQSADYSYYVYIRDYFPEIKQSTATARVTNATIQRLISDWSQQDVLNKAIAATILFNHNYQSTAKQILNSIREYSITSTSKGMWWPSLNNIHLWQMDKIEATALILNTFNTIEPNSKDVDLIRQWLILQKGAQNWGASVATTHAISSILNSGTKWHHTAQGSIIKINDSTIIPSDFESITGYFREDISSLQPSNATLSIIKPSNTPSWGALYYQYSQEMKDIAPSISEDVSIEKRIYRQITTIEGTKWEIAKKLNIGDKIKIELLLETSRDMDYVTIIDNRAACFEPVDQLPTPIFTEGIYFYRENKDASTNMFVNHLPKGTYLLSYEVYVNNIGSFASGIASVQSQYTPEFTAHSSGTTLTINSEISPND